MADARREHAVIFQVKGRGPAPKPYPTVSYRTGEELRAALARAAFRYWPSHRGAEVTFDGAGWRECRGAVFLRFPDAPDPLEVAFHPVHDPNRPAAVQARRPERTR